jgi:hypothetical protein
VALHFSVQLGLLHIFSGWRRKPASSRQVASQGLHVSGLHPLACLACVSTRSAPAGGTCTGIILHARIKRHTRSKKESYPRNCPFWDVEDPTLCTQSAHRWRRGCQPYAPAALYSKKYYFCVSGTHFCKRLSEPQGLVLPEGLGKLKMNSFTSSGLEPVCSIVP